MKTKNVLFLLTIDDETISEFELIDVPTIYNWFNRFRNSEDSSFLISKKDLTFFVKEAEYAAKKLKKGKQKDFELMLKKFPCDLEDFFIDELIHDFYRAISHVNSIIHELKTNKKIRCFVELEELLI